MLVPVDLAARSNVLKASAHGATQILKLRTYRITAVH